MTRLRGRVMIAVQPSGGLGDRLRQVENTVTFEVPSRCNVVDSRERLSRVGAQNLLDLLRRPDVEFPFHPLAVRVFGRVAGPLR